MDPPSRAFGSAEMPCVAKTDGTASMALVIAQTERDTYKRMYESLLARMTMEREETA